MITASIRNNQLNLLARRAGYNLALRHFRTAQEFSADVEDGFNLADVLNGALGEESIQEFQILPVVNILLAEKFGYAFESRNLRDVIRDVDALTRAVSAWTNIQVVLVYTDANDGIHLLNPEVPEHWEAVLPLAKDEHIVCYAGALEEASPAVLQGACKDVFTLLYGGRVRGKSAYKASGDLKRFIADKGTEHTAPEASGADDAPAAEPAAAVPASSSGGSKKLTAKIAVNVTNELFHNGNVESWKKVIESYKYKYPGLDVLIWYEGERINDINALFKWGKVKHGVPIMFSVAGDNPKDISKLRKYLFEGASPRFEAFLHGAPGAILQLF